MVCTGNGGPPKYYNESEASMMSWFIELSALTVWLYGDIACKVIFLIIIIANHSKGMSLPKPHRWLHRRTTYHMSRYRNKRYSCEVCKHRRASIWAVCKPRNTCKVHKWFLWRKPSEWEAETGRDGLIA